MEKYSYEDAFKASVNYFNGDELAAKVFLDANALKDNDGNLLEDVPDKMHRRMAKEFARIEAGKFKNPLTEDEIYNLFKNFKYLIPQSSPMTGIGNKYQTISLSNCFVCSSPEDSYGGIMKTDQQIVQLSKRRGGVGTNLSKLRPRGFTTKNSARYSTGVVSFAERFSNSIREVGQDGRRGALMEMISIHHPDSVIIPDENDKVWNAPEEIVIKGDKSKGERDIVTNTAMYNPNKIDFASMKLDRTKVTGANISIALSNEFLDAVQANKDFEQRFPINGTPVYTRKVNARKVWKKIIHMAWQSAEPGLLFWDRITKYNACDCYASKGYETICTNPCGELPIPAYDSCRLLVVVLLSYVKNAYLPNAEFDFPLFISHVKIAQRLMDDLVDLELEKIQLIIQKIQSDPEPEDLKREELNLWTSIYKTCSEGRRTGLGFTSLADMFAALGMRYDSKEAFEFADKMMMTFKHAAFQSSCDMAREVGPFPIWDWALEKDSEFLLQIKSENPALYEDFKRYGRRNIACLTIAPTGTPSIFAQTSSGCEPVFQLSYDRRKKINPGDKNSKIDFVDGKGDAWQTFKVYHHQLKSWMQATRIGEIAKSPWYGCCANDINWENRVKLQGILQKHIDHSISSTVNLPYTATEEDVAKIYETAWKCGCKGITVYRDGCRSGVLVNANKKSEVKLPKTNAPKRPTELNGEIHQCTVGGEKYYVVVGLFGDDKTPYEVFTGLNNEEYIPKDVKTGVIKKQARGEYVFISSAGTVYKLNNGHSDDTADALTRMISISLRHGTDISFIVHQLEKTKGPIISFSKALARTLKKYIKDGTTVSGEECPECGQKLSRKEGCISCLHCGYSKCH